jgi:hypothetical protein
MPTKRRRAETPLQCKARLRRLIERLSKRAAGAHKRAAQLKVELNARHAAGPDEFLQGGSVPPGVPPPQEFMKYLPVPPPQVRRAAARAGKLWTKQQACAVVARLAARPCAPRPWKSVRWITDVPNGRRKHRATGKDRGRRPNGDIGLADAVRTLASKRGIPLVAAQRVIADWLVHTATVRAQRINFSSAMDRVRRALA